MSLQPLSAPSRPRGGHDQVPTSQPQAEQPVLPLYSSAGTQEQPDPRVTIPYSAFPHIVELIYEFSDPQVQYQFRALSREWVGKVDSDWGTHLIFVGPLAPGGDGRLYQRCGLMGTRRHQHRFRTISQLPRLQEQMWTRRAPWKRPTMMDFVSAPTAAQRLPLRELAPQTIRLVGRRGLALNHSWTWATTASKCVLFCQPRGFQSSHTKTLALSYTVGEVVINLDPSCREGGENGAVPPTLTGYRRGLGRRIVYIYPELGDITFEDINYLARTIATYPGRIAWPHDADDLGSYIIVNFPGVHQNMTHASDERWRLPSATLREMFMDTVDDYRQGDFACSYRRNSRHHPIYTQGLLTFVSTQTYKSTLPPGVWEEETVLPRL